MQTRSKTAAARNRLASKSESELAEPPLRIGCFNLQKFGKIRRNGDVTSILVDVLKRYDLLLIMEQRTTLETNIDRLIQRLSTIDQSSPFDYEVSEAPCRMHGLKEQHCFFYRCHKLSVLHVHCYGDDPLSGKGWGKGHPRPKAEASHQDPCPVGIGSHNEGVIKSRADSSVSFVLPEDLEHHSADSLLFSGRNKKREGSNKESESSLISAMSFDNVGKDSGSTSPTSKKKVTSRDRGFGIGLRKSTSSVNLLLTAMIQEVEAALEDGSDPHLDDQESRGQGKDEDEAGCELGLRKSAPSVNIPLDASSQSLVGRLLQSIYDDDEDDDDDKPPVPSKEGETGSRGKIKDETEAGCELGLRKSAPSVNIPQVALSQGLVGRLIESNYDEDDDDDDDEPPVPSKEEETGSRGKVKDEKEAGCVLGLRKSAPSVNIPQVALSQGLVGRLIESIYDDDDDDDDDEPPVPSKEEETGSRGKVKDEKEAGCVLGLRKSAPSVNIPQVALSQGLVGRLIESIYDDDDDDDDDEPPVPSKQGACRQSDKETGHFDDDKRHRVNSDSSDKDEVEQKGRGIGLSKSKSHVNLPQEALLQSVSDETPEGSMEDHQQEEMDRSDESYALDDRSVAKGCEIGLRKSLSCVNIPRGILLKSSDKYVNDDDSNDILKGRENSLKRSVSCVDLPLFAILLTSDSDEEESPHRDISPRKNVSSANIGNCDSNESLINFDVGPKKSKSCVNLCQSSGKCPPSGILRGWTMESGAKFNSRNSDTKVHGYAGSKGKHTKNTHVPKVKGVVSDTCSFESSVHFADHPDVMELSDEWPELDIGLRKSESHVHLPLAANRQSEELVNRRHSESIEEIDEYREVEIGIRKSKSSFNLADSLHFSDTSRVGYWPTDPLLEDEENEEYVYESAPRSDLDEPSSPVDGGQQELVGLHRSYSRTDLTCTDALFFGTLPIVDESGSSLSSKQSKLAKKPNALTEASAQLDQLSRKGDLAAARSAQTSQLAKQPPSPKPKPKASKFCCTRGNNSDTDLPNVEATAGPSPTTSEMAAATRAASISAPVKGNTNREITQIMEKAPRVPEMNPPPVQSTTVTKQKPQMVAESPDPVKGENQNAKNSTTSVNPFEQNRPTKSRESGVRADSAIAVTADLSGSCSIAQVNELFAGNIKSQCVAVNQQETFSDKAPDALTITSLPTDPISYLSDDIYSSCSTMPSVTVQSRHERGQGFVSIPQTRPIPPTDTVTDSRSKTSTTRFADSAKVYCQKLASRIPWTGPPKCNMCTRKLEEASAKTICELCTTCKREILEKKSKLQKTENKESVDISGNKNQNTSVEDNNTDSDVTIICRKKKTANSGFVSSPPHSRSTDSTKIHSLWAGCRIEEDTRKHQSGPRPDVSLQHRTHKVANQERKRNEKKIIIQQQRVEGCAEIISWQNHNAKMDCHDMPVEKESTETHILSSEEAKPTSQFTNLPTERKDTRGATHTARKNAYGGFKDTSTENPNTEDQNMLGRNNDTCEDPDVAAGYQDTRRDPGNVHQNHSTFTVNKTPPASNPCLSLGRKNVCADMQGISWKTPNSSEQIQTTSTKMNKIKSTENLNTLSEIQKTCSASRHFKSEQKRNASWTMEHTSKAVNDSTHMGRMNTSTDIMNLSSSSLRSVNKSIFTKRSMPVTHENTSADIYNTCTTTVKKSTPTAVQNSHNTPTHTQDTSDCQKTALDNQNSSTDINTSTEYKNTTADALNTLTDSQNATRGKQNVSNHSQRGGQNTSRYSYTSSTENQNKSTKIRNTSTGNRNKSTENPNTSKENQNISSPSERQSTSIENQKVPSENQKTSTETQNTFGDSQNSLRVSLNTSTENQNTLRESQHALTVRENTSTENQNTFRESQHALTVSENTSTENQNTFRESQHALTVSENTSTENQNTFRDSQHALTVSENTSTENQNTFRDSQHALTVSDNPSTENQYTFRDSQHALTVSENPSTENQNTFRDSHHALTGSENPSTENQNTFRDSQHALTVSDNPSTENQNTFRDSQHALTVSENPSTENQNTFRDSQHALTVSENPSTENQNTFRDSQHALTVSENPSTENQNTFRDSQHALTVGEHPSTENQNTFRDSQHALTVGENPSTENQNTNADVENAAHLCYRMGSSNRPRPPPETGPALLNVFCREPFAVHFLSPLTDVTEFAVVVIHTYSNDAKAEVCAIQRIYDITSSKWYLQNMVLMGDFGMDESDRGLPYWRGVAVKSDRRFTKLLNDPENSVAPSAKDRNYDRLVLVGRELNKACIPSSVDIYRYDLELKLKDEQTAHVSDHYPLELQLAGLATTRWQKHVRTKGGVTIEQVHQVSTSADLKRLCKICKGNRASAYFHGEVLFDGPTGKPKEIRATRSDVTDVVKCLKNFQQAFPNILKDTTVSVASSFVTSPWMTSSPVYGLTFESDVKYAVTIIVTLQPPHMCQVHLQRQLCDGFTNDDETRLNYWTT